LLLAGGLVVAAGCGRKQDETASDVARAGKAVAHAVRDMARQAAKDAAEDAAEKAKAATEKFQEAVAPHLKPGTWNLKPLLS
jgi:DNA-binding protein YbaB